MAARSLDAGKAIIISQGKPEDLAAAIGSLDSLDRALSLPLEPVGRSSLPSFIELWGEKAVLRGIVAGWPFPLRAWLVTEHVPVAYERNWASGQASPGVRMVSSIHRRNGMSRSDFKAYWLGPHTEVALSYSVPVWHYNQNIVVEALTPGEDHSEDGFVGMHFRNAEQMRARWQDYPAEAARGAKDAANFMQVDRSESMTAVETVWENHRNWENHR